MKNNKVSVIIVKYRSEKYLQGCLDSVKAQNPYETIVVDNDKENRGYGAGCNFGAKRASGDLLFFLNPDSRLLPGCVDRLGSFFTSHSDVGIVGPKIYTTDTLKKIQLSYCRHPRVLSSLVVYGKVQNKWSNNPVWRHFSYQNKKQTKTPFKVDVVSGAAMMVRSDLFTRLGGFDEKLFMYFEENDLCLRAMKAGWSTYFIPAAKTIHYGGGSSSDVNKSKHYFNQSRSYFMEKHFPRYLAKGINILLA